jgi:hypothetical protein
VNSRVFEENRCRLILHYAFFRSVKWVRLWGTPAAREDSQRGGRRVTTNMRHMVPVIFFGMSARIDPKQPFNLPRSMR